MKMRIFASIEEWRRGRAGAPAFFAVGNFDGVHLGHQRIFRTLVEQAHAAGQWAVALTFEPHPLKLLRPDVAPPLITTLAQRLDRFESAGLDATVIVPFTREFAALTPEEFARRILGEALHASAVFVGENFRFGHRQSGDASLLVRLGEGLGFRVNIVEAVHARGEMVSSTLVRQAIEEGRVQRAGRMLGRPFALTGQIRSGTGQGRKLVVPTLNLACEQELLPARGVYATEAVVQGKLYRAATNIGFRPTFDGGMLVVESHLLQFAEEITGGPMEVRFWKRLREERKFPSPAELRLQVLQDIDRSRRFFARLDRRRPAVNARS
ncbi:MAG TPA: bifunctional riboflavin kinase/FAD synthetase [Candidatus Dormibacteraeota bacterium]|nr:bifunctional riboflavin kinase/FAD synthetase [Candidatus Dormibacteraeota bacterium]